MSNITNKQKYYLYNLKRGDKVLHIHPISGIETQYEIIEKCKHVFEGLILSGEKIGKSEIKLLRDLKTGAEKI